MENKVGYKVAPCDMDKELPEWRCRAILNEATSRFVNSGTTGDYLATVIREAYKAGQEEGR